MKTKDLLFWKSLCFACCFLLGFQSWAQKGSIKGNVIDGLTQESLPMANVVVKMGTQDKGTITDDKGNFSIAHLPAGSYIVEVSFIGYQTQILPNIKVTADGITPLSDIILYESSQVLDEFVIMERTNPLKVGETTKINLEAKQIANLPVQRNMGSILRTMTSEAKVSEDGQQINFRGARSEATAMYIDGVKMHDTSGNIPSTAIGSFQVFAGGVPAEYGDFTGGVIVIHTKDYFSLYQQYLADKKREEYLLENQEED